MQTSPMEYPNNRWYLVLSISNYGYLDIFQRVQTTFFNEITSMKLIKLSVNIFLLLSLIGCSTNDNKTVATQPDTIALSEADTILSSLDLYPQNIDVKGSKMILRQVNTEDIYLLFDKDSMLMAIKHGQGPDDIQSGELMKTMAGWTDSAFIVCDVMSGQIITITSNPPQVTKRPDEEIRLMSGLAVNDSLVIGHKNGTLSQFTIFNRNSSKTITVANPITMSDGLKEKLSNRYEYFTSTSIAVNPAKDRILTFSFFFDLMMSYTLSGEMLEKKKTVDVTHEMTEIIETENYVSYCLPYATVNFCYVRQIEYTTGKAGVQHLLKLDWDGNILAKYTLPGNIVGGYAIDNNSLYCIVSDTSGTEETIHILRYKLS